MNLDYIAKRDGKSAGFAAYGDSKLANILFTRSLAKRAPGVVVNFSFHPGFVQTGFGQNNQGVPRVAYQLHRQAVCPHPEKVLKP